MTTPHSDGLESGLPQQVNTWEEYYDYLNTRNQEGTLGDSLTLMTIAKNNSGRIIEHQHHNSPITIGLALNKKLNNHWSIETGLQYIYHHRKGISDSGNPEAPLHRYSSPYFLPFWEL